MDLDYTLIVYVGADQKFEDRKNELQNKNKT